MLKTITHALEQLQTQDAFSARETTGADDLHIEVTPIGRLKFPLKPGRIKRLIKEARPATFGWRDKTCMDTEVRDVWKIPKSRVKIDKRRWNGTLKPTLDKLKIKLGLPKQNRLKAELHEMLIYGPGQHFQSHQDSEKCDGMVATLVVALPSPHSGGALSVDHHGEKRSFQTSRTASDKLSFIAFYADCHHRVTPIKEGYRVVLIYNLILEGGAEKPLPSTNRGPNALSEALTSYLDTPTTDWNGKESPNRLVYLLDHQYTPKGLSWESLKSSDRERAVALKQVADSQGLEIHLALADVQEIWNCEPDLDWGYRSKQRYWDYDDDEEEEEEEENLELTELIDDATLIKHWRDASGKKVNLPEWRPRDRQICWTKANDAFNPFESDYEGWMGNYGNTMERWYHRAAIILWRREDRHTVLLDFAPETAIRELLRLMRKKSGRAQALESTRAMLPHWSGLKGTSTKPTAFVPVFHLALALGDSESAQRLLDPLGIEALGPESIKAIIPLQTAWGAAWLTGILRTWLDTSSTHSAWDSIIKNLAPIIDQWVKQAPVTHTEPTHWLMAHQLEALNKKRQWEFIHDSPAAYQHSAPKRIKRITNLLSAARSASDDAVFKEVTEQLIADNGHYPLSDLVKITRYLLKQSLPRDEMISSRDRLSAFVRGELAKQLDRPPRRPDDWSIIVHNRCKCEDCRELNVFLKSGSQKSKVWPMAKNRRYHIHQIIDGMGIPVTHRTEPKGSPHKLHLNKTQQLFQQEQVQRDQWKKALEEIGGST